MLTILLTYRDREVALVKNCLDSLQQQHVHDFSVVLIDYGSTAVYTEDMAALVQHYPFVRYRYIPVSKMLWNKSKALNIALQEVSTPYVLVSDIDMIFAPHTIATCTQLAAPDRCVYFKVAFLRQETVSEYPFDSNAIGHYSTPEATGITLFPTTVLKSIQGYDEFYHGWGAEDTDVHVRLQHQGIPVAFYDTEVLFFHQWHAKTYRSNQSTAPFHSTLEQLNHRYLQQVRQLQHSLANTTKGWGCMPSKDTSLPPKNIALSNERFAIEALLTGTLPNASHCVMEIRITEAASNLQRKQNLKKLVGKKAYQYLSMQEVNDRVLSCIISHFRHCYYEYEQQSSSIFLRLYIP